MPVSVTSPRRWRRSFLSYSELLSSGRSAFGAGGAREAWGRLVAHLERRLSKDLEGGCVGAGHPLGRS